VIRRWLDEPRNRRRAAIAGAALALLLVFAAFSLTRRLAPGEVVVRRGPLDSVVSVGGTLVPERSDVYGADVPGVELKILWLAEEGALVRAGDPLIRFDPAPFQKELEAALQRIRELSEESEQSRLAVTSTRLATRGELRDAETSAQAAERDLTAFVNTTAPLSAEESGHVLEQRQREADEARSKLEGLAPFVEQGYVSQEEYRTARNRAQQAEADLRLAQRQHAALVHQTAPDLLQQKSAENTTRQIQLGIQREKTQSQVAQAEAGHRLAEVKRDEAKRQRVEAERKVARCTATARAPGLVVYGEIFEKTGERRKVRAGDSVWGGTSVVALPDLSRFLVEARVPESEIHRLGPGQAARVRLDAFPDREIPAVVRRVGSLGTSEKNESRTFPLILSMSQSDPRFRPGMVARARVSCGSIADALYVPVEAVRVEDGVATCRVVSMGRARSRSVVTGANTSQFVQILRGLREGEVVQIGEN
jgi:HlyD family secretion protein